MDRILTIFSPYHEQVEARLRQLEGKSDDSAFQTKGLPNKAKAAEPATPGGYNTSADVVMSDKKKRKAEAEPETPASGKKEKKVRLLSTGSSSHMPVYLPVHLPLGQPVRLPAHPRVYQTLQAKKEKSAKKSEKKEKKDKKSKN